MLFLRYFVSSQPWLAIFVLTFDICNYSSVEGQAYSIAIQEKLDIEGIHIVQSFFLNATNFRQTNGSIIV